MPVPATSVASSYTAPSTQPPETEPLTVPSGATTIDAPGSRGADEYVRTTVPTPAVAPERQTAAKSWSSSLTMPKVGAFRDSGPPDQRFASPDQRSPPVWGRKSDAGQLSNARMRLAASQGPWCRRPLTKN